MCIEASHSKQSRIGESDEIDLTATRNGNGDGNGDGKVQSHIKNRAII